MYFYSSPSHATARSLFWGFAFAAHTISRNSPLTKAKNLEQKAAIEAKFNMEKPAVESGGDDEEDEAHSKKALLLLKPFIADESVRNELIALVHALWQFISRRLLWVLVEMRLVRLTIFYLLCLHSRHFTINRCTHTRTPLFCYPEGSHEFCCIVH